MMSNEKKPGCWWLKKGDVILHSYVVQIISYTNFIRIPKGDVNPWDLCGWAKTTKAYTLLHWSYPRDMRRLRAKQAAEAAAREEQSV